MAMAIEEKIVKKNKKRKQKKQHALAVVIWSTVFAFLCAFGCFAYAQYQINIYEEGVIDIYANQQDAYVQLVLDQINLNKSEKDDTAILDIIGTLDATSNKYWTLSENATMLFVKDVLETNKYKGFTTQTYYISDSAKEFLKHLSINKVTHNLIDMKDKKYIASGVVFQYEDAEYQICLLTNPDVVLDQNAYLGAKVNLNLMVIAVLAIFMITVIGMARYAAKCAGWFKREQETNHKLNQMIEDLNDRITEDEMYDVRQSMFHIDYLPMFYEKLQTRDVDPVTFLVLEYETMEARDFFTQDSILLLEKRIMRFADSKNNRILLVAVGMDEAQARKSLEWILYAKLKIVSAYCVRETEAEEWVSVRERLLGKEEKDDQ